jgi:hypothetical protein
MLQDDGTNAVTDHQATMRLNGAGDMNWFTVAIGEVDRFSLTHQFSLEAPVLPMAHMAPVFRRAYQRPASCLKHTRVKWSGIANWQFHISIASKRYRK